MISTILFGIAVVLALIFLFLMVIGDEDNAFPIFIINLLYWLFFMGLVGTSVRIPPKEQKIVTAEIQQTIRTPHNTILVFTKDKQEYVFKSLDEEFILDAKELVFDAGYTNIYGTEHAPVFNLEKTREIYNKTLKK
jgi:hypothetical protein